MTKITHINTITQGDNIQLSKKDFESIFEVMDGLDEKNLQLISKNEELKQQIKNLEAQLYYDLDGGVCRICKYQYLIKDNITRRYYIRKCKKEHDECSKNDLKYCKDFKLKGDNSD